MSVSLDPQEWERMLHDLTPVVHVQRIEVPLPPSLISYLRVRDPQGNVARGIQLIIHEHIVEHLRREREREERV